MNLEQAKRASQKGAYTAFLLAGLGFIAFTYFIFFANDSNPTPRSARYGDPLNYLASISYIIFGIGLLKFSRVAATVLFLLLITSMITGSITSFGPMGVFFALIIVYYFGNALRGTFTYHRIRRKQDPQYRRTPKWQYFIGIPTALILFVAITWVLMGAMGIVPTTEVLTGPQFHDKNKETLRQEAILLKNERVDFFYSAGFLSILEDGNILTEKRIISYETIDDNLDIYSHNLEDVAEYIIVKKGDLLNDTIVEVYDKKGNSFQLLLSTENNGDEKFIEALADRISPNKQKEKLEQTTASGENSTH